MSDDLIALEAWAAGLLTKISPGQRRVIGRQVAIELRRSQAQRIAQQRAPDGTAYVPRKNRKEFRGKAGRIKRQKAAMFNKLRTTAYLQTRVDENQIAVGFFGRVARLAHVHQEGLPDRVAPTGPTYNYPARPLLGFSAHDRDIVRDILLRHLVKG
jgi:phage virion morphogenesis protein